MITAADAEHRARSAPSLQVIGLPLAGEVVPGAQVAELLLAVIHTQDIAIEPDDVLAVTQKIVSKAEGRLVRLDDVEPSPFACQVAAAHGRDPRLIELVLRESRRIVRMDHGVLITETHHGLVCANAGVDASNVAGGSTVSLLPLDPDRSAAEIRGAIGTRLGVWPAVIITDTFGRPWRNGLTNVAIGAAGLAPMTTFAGQHDAFGYELRVTEIAVADELAGAAELVMGKISDVPFALIRGFHAQATTGSARDLVRAAEMDLFR
jgi:coenzyme F420-0:L-glutamate ligase/coenzyme F420-1:gamma-L-glutamate ligase